MRKLILLSILLLAASLAEAGQGCLNIISQQPVFCPKCSDPGASPGMAAKKISASLCASCSFYCWYTKTADGGEFNFMPTSEVEGPASKIGEPGPDTPTPGCLPSDAERDRVLSMAIPLALHMQRDDFERLAADDPVSAAVIAMMLWRGDDSSMTDASHFAVQFKGMPSYEDAIDLFDDHDQRIKDPWSMPLDRGAFLHVEVTGERLNEDHVQLTVRAAQVTARGRKQVGEPTVIEVKLGDDEVPTSFAGKMVVAREALATYR